MLLMRAGADADATRLLDRAIRSFNVNPKRGLKFVTGPSGMVEPGDASGLADFLLTTRGLNKEKVSVQKPRCRVAFGG